MGANKTFALKHPLDWNWKEKKEERGKGKGAYN